MESSTDRDLALVTGASSGIGLELARQFAQHGFDLIIAAEDTELAAATTAIETHGVRVMPVQVDLATADGVEALWRRVQEIGRPLDAAALNAGVGGGGAFKDSDLQDELRIVDLNVRSTVHLAWYVVRDMAARDHGRILITSSIASAIPGFALTTVLAPSATQK